MSIVFCVVSMIFSKRMSDVSDNEFASTPPELKQAAEKACEDLLPVKSKSRYEFTYKTFKDCCFRKQVQNINSENILMAYFSELSETLKASTLWARYSMLRSTLKILENVDISKFSKLIAYLKKQNVGYKPKKSNVFTKEDIDKFLQEEPDQFLPQKVALIIGVSGACRSDELFKMKFSDTEILENNILIVIPNTKTYQPRTFVITNSKWIAIIKQYVNLRKSVDGLQDRFFMQVQFNKITRQLYGHNSISNIPKKIASYLKLQNVATYTGHCFRRTSATLLANNGGNILQVKRLDGWKSSGIAEDYVHHSLDSQLKIAKMLSKEVENHPSFSVAGSSTSLQQEYSFPGPLTSTTNINSVSNSNPNSIMQQQFNFSTEQLKHGLCIGINSHDNPNITINFHNLPIENKINSSP